MDRISFGEKALPSGAYLSFLGYRGSEAHGTTVPSDNEFGTDDIDLIGSFIAPIENYFGFAQKETSEQWIGEYDIVLYDIRKYVSLLLKSNPNILSTLWLKPEHILASSSYHDKIAQNRSMFASKAVYQSFCGYANGQLRRMTRHTEDNPLRDREIQDINAELQHRKDMVKVHGLGNYARSPYDNWSEKKLRTRYNDLRGTSGYMGEKRRKNVERFGFDMKHGAHAIRLLRMGVEFLQTGPEFTVDRSEVDAEEIVSIKCGGWSLERVQKESERLFDKARDALSSSSLPDKPDRDGAEQLLVEILKDHFS